MSVEVRNGVFAKQLQKQRYAFVRVTKPNSDGTGAAFLSGLSPSTLTVPSVIANETEKYMDDIESVETDNYTGSDAPKILSTLEQELQRYELDVKNASERSTKRKQIIARKPLFNFSSAETQLDVLRYGKSESGERGLTKNVKISGTHPKPAEEWTPKVKKMNKLNAYTAGLDSYRTSILNVDQVIEESEAWLDNFMQNKRDAKREMWNEAGLIHPHMVESVDTIQKREQRRLAKEKRKQNKQKSKKEIMEEDGFEMVGPSSSKSDEEEADADNTNQDTANDEGWIQVMSGGRHGRSLLPADARATVSGYGGKSVRVGKDSQAVREKAEPKKIVGDNFYRFGAIQERKRQLDDLRNKFKDDQKVWREKRLRHK